MGPTERHDRPCSAFCSRCSTPIPCLVQRPQVCSRLGRRNACRARCTRTVRLFCVICSACATCSGDCPRDQSAVRDRHRQAITREAAVPGRHRWSVAVRPEPGCDLHRLQSTLLERLPFFWPPPPAHDRYPRWHDGGSGRIGPQRDRAALSSGMIVSDSARRQRSHSGLVCLSYQNLAGWSCLSMTRGGETVVVPMIRASKEYVHF